MKRSLPYLGTGVAQGGLEVVLLVDEVGVDISTRYGDNS